MHQPTQFPQLILSRSETFLRRLREIVWKRTADELRLEATECFPRLPALEDAKSRELRETHEGEGLGRRFHYVWYRVTLPEKRQGDWICWRHGGECTAYFDGAPWAGFDWQHFRFRLPDAAKELWIAVMHMNDGDVLKEAGLDQRDDAAWHAWHDLEVLVDLAHGALEGLELPYGGNFAKSFAYRPSLEFVPRSTRLILHHLDKAASAFERGGVAEAGPVLAEAIRALPADTIQMPLVTTAQAHLDPVHMWPEHVGRFKIVHTWSTATLLMDEYEDMHFLFSQPAAYQWVSEMEPVLSARVGKRLKEGRWEAEGAAWVEFDTNMPCGEAMLRALLIGQARARKDAGKEGRILWLPDTFGYSACLPQLMRLAGVDSFWTTKLQWSTITHFPLSSFRWKGNDGSEVMAHMAQHYMGYSVNGLPRQFQNIEKINRQSHVHNESIAPVGYGDGGGGIKAEQIERTRRCRNLHNVPKARFGKVADFFERLHGLKDQLPAWHGEIYLEYHRGVLTSCRNIKTAYRAAERQLQTLEAVHIASGRGPVDPQYWERLCLMQFHDIITGSSLVEAIDACATEMGEMVERAKMEALKVLSEDGGEACLFNPLPVAREALLEDGSVLTLAPLEGKAIAQAAARESDPVQATDKSLKNDRLEMSLDASACIAEIIIDGKALQQASPLASLWLYPEMPTAFDVWEIEEPTLLNGTRVDSPAEITSQQHPDGSASLFAKRSIGRHSSATVEYRLEPDADYLRINIDIDWQEPRHLLKMHFPTDYQGRMARFGCPFGSVLRSQQPNAPSEQAQWEAAGSRWAAVCDDAERDGLFLVTKDSFGFSCREGRLTVSLVRSPAPPEADAARLGRLLDQGAAYDESEMAGLITDLGHHRLELAIGRHAARAPESQAAALADRIFTPCLEYQGKPVPSPLPEIECSPSLIPAWAQPLDADRWILRLHEVAGSHTEARLTPAEGWQAVRCDARGKAADEKETIFRVRPYEILSLLIEKN
ncbi:MAG: alpha-mannosidase [Candidatus Sumerlaeia bacterium]